MFNVLTYPSCWMFNVLTCPSISVCSDHLFLRHNLILKIILFNYLFLHFQKYIHYGCNKCSEECGNTVMMARPNGQSNYLLLKSLQTKNQANSKVAICRTIIHYTTRRQSFRPGNLLSGWNWFRLDNFPLENEMKIGPI